MRLIVDGTEINVNGRNISVRSEDGKTSVIADGTIVGRSIAAEPQIQIIGNIERLTCNNAEVDGDVGSIDATQVNCGNVSGSINAAQVKCGEVYGSINATQVKTIR